MQATSELQTGRGLWVSRPAGGGPRFLLTPLSDAEKVCRPFLLSVLFSCDSLPSLSVWVDPEEGWQKKPFGLHKQSLVL